MKENPLYSLYSTLVTLNRQPFNDPNLKKMAIAAHNKTTQELFEIGQAENVMKLRFNVNTRYPAVRENFVPCVVDRFEPMGLTLWIKGHNGNSRPIVRELLGRTHDETVGPHVFYTEFFRAEGDQDPLFQIAQRHEGITGTEGTIPRMLSREEARELLFTRNGREESSEVVLFDTGAGKRELVTV